MHGVSFPQQTTVYGKPAGWKDEDCYGLPVSQSIYLNSDEKPVPCLISCWEQDLTDVQLEEIVRTRKVRSYLSITGTGMPPVSISLDSPFTAEYSKELALEMHENIREGRI